MPTFGDLITENQCVTIPQRAELAKSGYRAHRGFAHEDVALSAGVQRMVRSDLGASGVAFTIDTESGFEDVVFITSAWGLGEMVVQGQANPDEFYVHKPTLAAGRPPILRRERGSKALKMVYSDDPAERVAVVDVPVGDRRRFSLDDGEVVELARHAVAVERHYGRPVATIAAAFRPKPVIVRLSDFKSDEYANLVGGELYEPGEANPMLGFRGAARYVSDEFRPSFELECRAMRRVRDEMGFTNVELMVPFVRTLDEAREVVELLARNGLERGRNGLRIVMMCEVPSNAILAEEFLEHFDGFFIGSNDLTQMTLGLDRNSELVASRFDERDPAVKALLQRAIAACRKHGKYVGICGQGPSDHPDLARWLMEQGIDSVSLNPDSVVETWLYLGGEG